MDKRHFLLTGCAGFIGGHTLDRLIKDGHAVTGLDDLSTGSPTNMEAAQGRFTFIEGSICDPKAVARALEGVTHVIHLASVPSVPRSVAEPLESATASIIGTVTLFDAARRSGVKRVVQAASSSAYGDNPALPKKENQLPLPMSPYAVAKLTQEYYGFAFGKCYGLDVISLRYFNVFGPRQNPDSMYAAVIPKFITMMKRGEHPIVYGDGEQTRDFTFIDNVVEANVRAALAPDPMRGAVANIGGGRGHSLNHLVTLLNDLLGTKLDAVHEPPRVGDVKNSLADVAKARELFGYEVLVDFAEGVKRTVDSFS
ncbi:MAG: NAD-dependent epimerase/dehydratase family protein [Planctomycetaceae bacterium]|nr:NAD-dependent epimerase/dehydratase family protein [Planctomycetaceae bacterium]